MSSESDEPINEDDERLFSGDMPLGLSDQELEALAASEQESSSTLATTTTTSDVVTTSAADQPVESAASASLGVSAVESSPAVDSNAFANDRLLDTGTFLFEQGKIEAEEVMAVLRNLHDIIEDDGAVDHSDMSVFYTLVKPLANELQSLFKTRFRELRMKALGEDIVFRFLIQLQSILVEEVAPSKYFSDLADDSERYARPKDAIFAEDFLALWRILDEAPVQSGEFHVPFQGDARVKAIAMTASSAMMRLVKDTSWLNVCLDDLMIAARSADMSNGGWSIGMNEKKASGTGHSIDVLTATNRLHLVVSLIITDSVDKRTGNTRQIQIKQALQDLKSITGGKILTRVDRGYEFAIPAILTSGSDIVGTSQRGSVYQKNHPLR